MSVRATNFVRGLRGLSPSEKAVAFVLADHDDHKGGGTYPGMLTVAKEAGLKDRTIASRITRRLVDRGIIRTDNPSKGRKSTVYRFNFDLTNRDSSPHPTVTLDGPNRDSPVTGRVEGLREGGHSLLHFSQEQKDSKLREPVPTRSQFEKAIGKIAKPINPSASTNGGQRAHLEAGIYRKEIEAAYFDAANGHIKPDECIRLAIHAGALSLMANRSVELRGLEHKDLSRNAWARIQSGVAALHEIKDFELRSKHLVPVVTHCLTSVALEFWERACAEANATARQ